MYNDNDPLSETFLNDLNNTFNLQMDTTILKNSKIDDHSSETTIIELDNTSLDLNDTLNSTVCASQMDNTYDLELDNSITVLKSVIQSNDKTKDDKKKKKSKEKSHTNNGISTDKQTVVTLA